MVDTIFSSASRQRLRAVGLKESSKDKKRSPEERKDLAERSKEASSRAKAIDKKREEVIKKLGKLARKKVQSRRTFKKSKTTLHLKQAEVPSILGEPNRFFKDEMGEAEHALFFR